MISLSNHNCKPVYSKVWSKIMQKVDAKVYKQVDIKVYGRVHRNNDRGYDQIHWQVDRQIEWEVNLLIIMNANNS